ncbi:MAG: hypothetical protein LCH93_16785 [Proteobacteria bacterium]|nr:hypothetical protein [Pseudomonadota bacterium]
MNDQLNAAARIVAIVADSLTALSQAPPNSRASSDGLDYLAGQIEAYKRAWGSARTFPATEAYILALMQAATEASKPNDLLESGSRKESALPL